MNDEEIAIIGSESIEETSKILRKFLLNNEDNSVRSFPSLNENNRRVILWTLLFEHLQKKSSASIYSTCLSTIRILSRDKTDIEGLICEKWITILIEKAGLYNFTSNKEESVIPVELPYKDVAVEALKCLCNLSFNSKEARVLCAQTCLAQGLASRLKVYKDMPYKEEVMLYDMKLLFILTALTHEIKMQIKEKYNGMEYLINCIKEILLDASSRYDQPTVAGSSLVDGCHQYHLTDNQQAIVCEVLKTQFNLVVHSNSEEPANQAEEDMYIQLILFLSSLILVKCSNEEKLMELRSNIANLLTSVPSKLYCFLSPELKKGETCQYTFENRNMNAIHALVELLQYRLTKTTDVQKQYENLSPILTVMNKGSRSFRQQRKYLRQVVLPPLRDVSCPPEKGNTLRNQLCRLLTTPVTSVRDLVAEFLFILCKEKVGRMVKYTGFGNAAGHLAQKGLLGGGRGAEYSSSSDDSDTEEYLEAQPNIDPVVGCTRPPRVDPFEGMTDEQKEYEAMKLVNLFDKMVSQGVVKPAMVGPDGRPQPVRHVLQLREQPPTRPQS